MLLIDFLRKLIRGAPSILRYRGIRGFCILLGATSLVTAAPGKRPNLLLILADNWAWPHAGILGDPMARTPAFDRIAHEGVVFSNTFNPVPSCSPTRACLLTGRIAHQLGERASLWSAFPRDTPVITELLEQAGYQIGYSGKPWGPGNHETSGWTENPVGPKFASFEEFHAGLASGRPFFFWLGNTDTATKGGRLPFLEKAESVLDASKIAVPPELPDTPETRKDLLNYYGGVMSMDEAAAKAIAALEKSGQLENTVVIYTSDNGWQMPRGLANCYDAGSRVPLAIRWGRHLQPGRRVEEFINVAEIGPTLLELAGLRPPSTMTLHSFRNLLLGLPDPTPRAAAFIERERHANVRRNNLSYPMRAIRTRDFLYVRNLRPDRWPAGDPDVLFVHGRPYGDVDTTLTKDFLLRHVKDPAFARYISLIFGKRPAEELYDLSKDPHQLTNIAGQPGYKRNLEELRRSLDRWMSDTDDPRTDPANDAWDFFPYYGKPPKLD
ncbi:MAG: sulfatase [Opitutaceae bacterium]|nr:sulfatase [Opitutaceae bacterium]